MRVKKQSHWNHFQCWRLLKTEMSFASQWLKKWHSFDFTKHNLNFLLPSFHNHELQCYSTVFLTHRAHRVRKTEHTFDLQYFTWAVSTALLKVLGQWRITVLSVVWGREDVQEHRDRGEFPPWPDSVQSCLVWIVSLLQAAPPPAHTVRDLEGLVPSKVSLAFSSHCQLIDCIFMKFPLLKSTTDVSTIITTEEKT